MSAPLTQFNANIGHVRDLVGLAIAVDSATTSALDTSDILRASLVAAVSALDHYIHEIVRDLMIETANGLRPATDAFRRFSISADAALRASQGTPASVWMDEEVRRQHGHLAFQHPDKIADAIRLVYSQPLWPAVSGLLSAVSADPRQDLLLVVQRRNRIAHEADLDPTPPHTRWPISSRDVEGAIGLIEGIVGGLDGLL